MHNRGHENEKTSLWLFACECVLFCVLSLFYFFLCTQVSVAKEMLSLIRLHDLIDVIIIPAGVPSRMIHSFHLIWVLFKCVNIHRLQGPLQKNQCHPFKFKTLYLSSRANLKSTHILI